MFFLPAFHLDRELKYCPRISHGTSSRQRTRSSTHQQQTSSRHAIFSLPVIIAALGYFIDIYDLVLFSIVRVPSLKALGLQGKELIDQGVFLLNMQMAGMLVGGVLWGILGDRKGRLKI